MRRGFSFFTIGLVGFSLFACQPKERHPKIALAIPLTGDIASLGNGIKRAVQMAVAEANGTGRFSPPLELVLFDDRSDPKEAVSVANRIVSDPDIIGVIGHFNSGCSIPASLVYARANLPMLSPASSNPSLTEQQLSPQWIWPRNIFRVNTTDNVQGVFGANFVFKELKATKVGIVHDKTAYGQGVAEEFKKQLLKNGGQVVAFEGLQVGDRDFRSLLTRIKATGPQAIYFGGMFSEGGTLLRQTRDIGFNGAFVACEANLDPVFLQAAGEASDGAFVTFLGSPPELLPSAKQFVDAYKVRYPKDDIKPYDHYGYQVAQMLMDSLEKVGSDRLKIIATLHATTFKGVLGETRFDEKGDTLNKTITLFIAKGGMFIPYSSLKGR